MKYKFKPLMLGSAIAVSAALSGCGSDQAQPEITDVFKETGLWCKNPEIVQIASADSYALSADEQAGLDAGKAEAKAAAMAEAGENWDEAAWEADFEYQNLDLYSILGLTIEETERQAIAKEEARAYQVGAGQDVIRGEGFDEWFDAWFAGIAPATYLGTSQRINRSVNATTSAMDGEEICYTPPLSCPNYKVIDESGNYDCIIPEQNPIEDAPAPAVAAGPNEAIAFYRHEDHVDGGDNSELYENIVVHTWNDEAGICTSYQDDSISNWGSNATYPQDNNGIDPNYGKYWKLSLLDEPANCANIIFNDTQGTKRVSDSDLMMPIGPSGNVTLHNLDKNAYADDNFPVNVFDGMLLINQHPFFGATASSGLKSCGWSMEADESGEQCLGQELICPEGSVAVGVGAVDIASKCVLEFNPEETDLLLRGGFNGWGGADDPNFDASQLAYVGGGQYRVNYPYTTDCEIVEAVEASDGVEAVEGEDCVSNYDFKVADLGWSEPATFGSIKGGDQSAVGTTIVMTVGSDVGQNMKVDMGKDKIYQFLVNAADVAAVELTISEVPVNAFPMLIIGESMMELSYTTNGQYVVRMELAAETHSFTISDESTGFAVGAIGTDNVVMENTPLALENGGGALSFTSVAAEYDFILNMVDPAMPTLEIKPALPFGTDKVFIRGTVTGWGDPAPAEDEIIWNGDDRTYSVIYGLEADVEQSFKFASQAWGGKYDLGDGNFIASPDGETLSGTFADSNSNGNISVTPSKSTSYKFSISYATADPVVKVEEAPLYLRGGITGSGWGADDGNQLGFMSSNPGDSSAASHTYSLEVNYAGGAAQFKVADEGWGGNFGYNYGTEVADTAVVLGEALTLVNSNNNILIDVPAGTYIFAFEDGVTKTMTVTAKE